MLGLSPGKLSLPFYPLKEGNHSVIVHPQEMGSQLGPGGGWTPTSLPGVAFFRRDNGTTLQHRGIGHHGEQIYGGVSGRERQNASCPKEKGRFEEVKVARSGLMGSMVMSGSGLPPRAMSAAVVSIKVQGSCYH